MTDYPKKRRWLIVPTVASILVGLNFAGPGAIFLIGSVLALLGFDLLSIGVHAYEILTTSAILTLVGAVPVAAGIYALVATRGFRRWGTELPTRVKIGAVVAWIGLVIDAALFLAPFALAIPGFG